VNKGFGFITTEAGEDIFVHFRSIRGRGRRSLRQGQKVRFDISNGEKGLQADNVSVIGE
jgi:CspA family cold shock protein